MEIWIIPMTKPSGGCTRRTEEGSFAAVRRRAKSSGGLCYVMEIWIIPMTKPSGGCTRRTEEGSFAAVRRRAKSSGGLCSLQYHIRIHTDCKSKDL